MTGMDSTAIVGPCLRPVACGKRCFSRQPYAKKIKKNDRHGHAVLSKTSFCVRRHSCALGQYDRSPNRLCERLLGRWVIKEKRIDPAKHPVRPLDQVRVDE